jgi:hypothetical protein
VRSAAGRRLPLTSNGVFHTPPGGVTILQVELTIPGPLLLAEEAIDAAFSFARQRHARAVVNAMVPHRARLAALAASHRLLSISDPPVMAQAGFLMT